MPVHVRPLGGRHARLSLLHPLPVQTGDRAILRDPGRQAVADGVLVLDAEPTPLRRRGAAARRAAELASQSGRPDLLTEVRRRGAVRRADLTALGLPTDAPVPQEVREVEDWLVHEQAWGAWVSAVAESVRAQTESTPLEPTVSLEAARRAAGVPDARLVPALAVAAGLEVIGGRLQVPGGAASLGPAEPALRELSSGWRPRRSWRPNATRCATGSWAAVRSPRRRRPDGCCGWTRTSSCSPPRPRWRCRSSPGCLSRSPSARPGRRWAPRGGWLCRCWSTSTAVAGPAGSTPPTAPSSAPADSAQVRQVVQGHRLTATRRARRRQPGAAQFGHEVLQRRAEDAAAVTRWHLACCPDTTV